VRELFDEDVDIVLFKSVEEAADKAAFYLKNYEALLMLLDTFYIGD
jgi:hypothetical protein